MSSVATAPLAAPSTRRQDDSTPLPANRFSAPLVVALAAMAGVIAALAPPSPTGRSIVDSVMVGIAAGAVTLAGSRAPLWSLVLVSGAAIAIAGNPIGIAAGVAALGLAIAGRGRLGSAPLCTVAAGLAVNVLARAQLGVGFGVTSLVAITVSAVVLFAGIRRFSPAVRRTVYGLTAAAVVVAAVSTVALGLAALRARHALAEGVRLAEEAVASLEYGDYETASVEFEQAASALQQAHDDVSSPWARGAGLVPVVAQHYDAVVDLSAAGASGSAITAEALADIDLEDLRIDRGHVDLAAVSGLAGPLGRVEEALTDLHAIVEQSDSPWLIDAAQYEITDFRESIAAHLPQLENALDAIELAPRLLGADEPVSYLVLFTSPVEARPLGGAVFDHVELLADDGQLSIAGVGGDAGDTAFAELTMTADFPRVGEDARTAYARASGRSVDGVIALDPQVLAALLWYADPIQMTTFDQQLDPYNAAQFLLRDQYLGAGDSDPAVDAVSEVGPLVVDTLLAGAMPDPTTLARDLGPLAADRRMLMWSADPEAQQLLERVGLGGAIPALDGREGWAITVSNAAGNKIDSFLSATTSYDSSLDAATGLTSAVIRVELTNTAPRSGLPPDVIGNEIGLPSGTSMLDVSAHSSLELVEATVDGTPVDVEVGTEAGWNVYSKVVTLPYGEVVTLEFRVAGAVDRPGEVVTWKQPLAIEVTSAPD